MKRGLRSLVFALVLTSPLAVGALTIGPVRTERVLFEPAAGETLDVRFRLSDPAHATLLIYDSREVQVRAVESDGELAAGENRLSWDGRDDNGRLLPPEAYYYVIRAKTGDETAVYDPTDTSGAEMLISKDVSWDPDAGVIRYLLPGRARVNVRIGLQNEGPLLRVLRNWVPRLDGIQEEPWDGRDQSGVLDLTRHPKLRIVVHAVELPANALFVGPLPDERSPFVEVENPIQRPVTRERKLPRRSFVSQDVEFLKDVEIELRLPSDLPTDAEGIPIVSGRVPIEMDIPDPDEKQRLLAERVETAFFVDGSYSFENEAGFLPTSWTWDPTGVNPGVHYITGNLLGFEGHFGTATLKVVVPAPPTDDHAND